MLHQKIRMTHPILRTMKTKYSLKFFLKNEKNNQGQHKIFARIRVERTKAEFYTQRLTPLEDWDSCTQLSKNDQRLNSFLYSLRNKVDEVIYQLEREDVFFNASHIKKALLGHRQRVTLISYFQKEIERIKELPDEYSGATITIYVTSLKHLSGFLKLTRRSEITLNGLDLKTIEEFEHYLRVNCGHHVNTATKYIRKLRAVVNKAIKYQEIDQDPFAHYKMKSKKTNRVFLTMAEIERIKALEQLPFDLVLVRDIFMWSIYTGLRYSDTQLLAPENIRIDKNGDFWIDIVMKKSKNQLRVPIMSEALKVLLKYELQSERTGRCFPALYEQKYNLKLKQLANMAGIQKNISSHVARHTFATTVRSTIGMPIEVTSKLLGHSKLATTMIYAKITDDEVLNYMKGLNNDTEI